MMVDTTRYNLFCDLIAQLDIASELIQEYDTQLHDYKGTVLYQAESQLIKLIGHHPGISAVECAVIFKKTMSACSQLIKKLKSKGWIKQERNEQNKRVYNLYLTDAGKVIYENHKEFEESCYQRTFGLLDSFAEKDFDTYIQIQKLINQGFQLDIEDGKHLQLNTDDISNDVPRQCSQNNARPGMENIPNMV